MENENKRNSSVELLRIVAAGMIIASHCAFHGILEKHGPDIGVSFNKFFLQSIQMGSLGVDIFVIITGYYMVDKMPSIRKVARLFQQILFYSLLSFTVAILFCPEKLNIFEILRSFFPVLFGRYWFATTYVVLYIFTPFINIGLKQIAQDKKQYQKMMAVMLLLWSVLPTFTRADLGSSSEVILFIMLYTIGAYFHFFPSVAKKHCIDMLLLLAVTCWFGIVLVGMVCGSVVPYLSDHITYFFKKESPITLFTAVLFVVCFLQKIFYRRWINVMAGGAFASYLLTDNYLVRELLWNSIIKVDNLIDRFWLPAYILFCVLLLYLLAMLIEQFRTLVLEKQLMKLFDRIADIFKEQKYRKGR